MVDETDAHDLPKPFQSASKVIDGDARQREAIASVREAQFVVRKLSSVPESELKFHCHELDKIKIKLAVASEDTPGFWSASSQMIQLLSKAMSNISSTPTANIVIDKMDGSDPDLQSFQMIQLLSKAMSNISSTPTNIVIDKMDGSDPDLQSFRASNVLLKNRVAGVTFINSIITFDPSVSLAHDRFINCVFTFPSVGQFQKPPESLRKVIKLLLASDLANVTVKSQ